jgi:hypothetical protein
MERSQAVILGKEDAMLAARKERMDSGNPKTMVSNQKKKIPDLDRRAALPGESPAP